MAQAMGGLFGPSADEVRLAIAQQGREQDMQWGNLEPGRGPTVLAAQSGRMLGDALAGLGGYQDPRVKSAQLMQEAAQEVDNQGYSLLENSQEYYKAAYASLMKRGLTAEAAEPTRAEAAVASGQRRRCAAGGRSGAGIGRRACASDRASGRGVVQASDRRAGHPTAGR